MQTKPATDKKDIPQMIWLLCSLVGAIFDRTAESGRRFLAFWAVDPIGPGHKAPDRFPDWPATLRRLQTDRAYFLEEVLQSIQRLSGVGIEPSTLHRFPEKTPAEIGAMFGDVMRELMTREDSPEEMWSAMFAFYSDLETEAQTPESNEAQALSGTPLLLTNLMSGQRAY